MSHSKQSFMFDKSLLEDFAIYIGEYTRSLETNSRFQTVRAKYRDIELLLYQSGILIYKGPEMQFAELEQILQQFFASKNQVIPELEIKREVVEESSGRTTSKSIWLDEKQLQSLCLLLEERGYNEEKILHKHEYKRFKLDECTLIINKNSTVFTIGADQDVEKILDEILHQYPIIPPGTMLLALSMNYRFSKVGPVCVSAVVLANDQLRELQLSGFKHPKIVRSLDPAQHQHLLDELKIERRTTMIEPQTINELADNMQINKYLGSSILTILNTILEPLSGKIAIISDAEIQKILADKLSTFTDNHSQFPDQEEQENSPALGLCSLINMLEYEKWVDRIEEEFDIHPHPSHLESLKNHPDNDQILKLLYS